MDRRQRCPGKETEVEVSGVGCLGKGNGLWSWESKSQLGNGWGG